MCVSNSTAPFRPGTIRRRAVAPEQGEAAALEPVLLATAVAAAAANKTTAAVAATTTIAIAISTIVLVPTTAVSPTSLQSGPKRYRVFPAAPILIPRWKNNSNSVSCPTITPFTSNTNAPQLRWRRTSRPEPLQRLQRPAAATEGQHRNSSNNAVLCTKRQRRKTTIITHWQQLPQLPPRLAIRRIKAMTPRRWAWR